ncbi:MAG: S-layer homology domain-containing protein [Oscillibacter sp.]
MKKRMVSLLLAFALLLSGSAWATGGSTEHFARSKTYAGQFSDLTEASPFYANVAALYEYGLSVGKSDGTYGLGDSMTVGEIVIFAGRIRSLYASGDAEAGAAAYGAEGQRAYLSYLRYLQAEAVLGPELDQACAAGLPATRGQVAHVLAGILPREALPAIHMDLVTQGYASRQFIPDVTEYTPYFQDILTLYQCGVSMGNDPRGSYLPEAAITRGAAAAMLTRMVDPALRVTPAWTLLPAYSAVGTTLAELVPSGAYLPAPATAAEMELVVRDMLSKGKNTLELQYSEMTALSARKVMEQALSAVKLYCEQCYNAVSCTYTLTGGVTLRFSASGAEQPVETYRETALAAAIAVHDQLWAEGSLTADMTEYEKARVYYTWICAHCAYDYSADLNSLSHIAYNLFENGSAVCDGYTGAYNLLLKLEGISCTALSNSQHIWTVATLDGTEYHIDTTWGDSGPAASYAYFAMTEEQSRLYHQW